MSLSVLLARECYASWLTASARDDFNQRNDSTKYRLCLSTNSLQSSLQFGSSACYAICGITPLPHNHCGLTNAKTRKKKRSVQRTHACYIHVLDTIELQRSTLRSEILNWIKLEDVLLILVAEECIQSIVCGNRRWFVIILVSVVQLQGGEFEQVVEGSRFWLH